MKLRVNLQQLRSSKEMRSSKKMRSSRQLMLEEGANGKGRGSTKQNAYTEKQNMTAENVVDQRFASITARGRFVKTVEAQEYASIFKNAQDVWSVEDRRSANTGKGERDAKLVVAPKSVCI